MSIWILLFGASLHCTSQPGINKEAPVEDLIEKVSSSEEITQVIERPADEPEAAAIGNKNERQDVVSSPPVRLQQQTAIIHDAEKVSTKVVGKDIRQEELPDGASPPLEVRSHSEKLSEVNQDAEEIARLVDMLPHQSFDQLLQKYVNAAGKVNYKGFLADQEQLDAYLESLSGKSPQADWSRSKKLAHWINVYNAFTIRLILDHYPVNSIQDISGGKPWDKQWIDIGGQTYSLNQIENDIIRPRFGEPRIHFAVNCAAKSCPPLANKAFTEENLNTLLEQQTRAFINNPTFNSITANSLQISKIFDWYGVDFKNLIEFINKYAEIEISSDATVSYKDYNWNLNN